MRRKLTALCCALALLAGLAAPASAAPAVYFIGISDETVLELSDAAMPFWANGYLYVPGTVFNTQSLGTAFTYNPYKGRAVVYRKDQPFVALLFDLNRRSVDDNDGYGYYPPAVVRNGIAFVAVSLVCSYFGFATSTTKVENGYLIRVCGPDAVLSDRSFAEAASYTMDLRYQQYLAAREAAQETEPPAGQDPDPDPPSEEDREVALCFRPGSRTVLASLLDALDSAGAAGTFCLTKAELSAWGGLVRRMTAGGHAVALLIDGGGEGEAPPVADRLAAANDALWRAAGIKTRLCFLEDGGDADGARAAGYRAVEPDLTASRGLTGSAGAEALAEQLKLRRGDVSVWLGEDVDAGSLSRFLRLTEAAGGRFVCLRETWQL